MTEMEEKAKTEALYERFRSTFNKLTPEKFDSLLSQFRSLQIDTQEKMEGVVNLVFEMAISEPDSCVAYALMCKELALMQVSGTNPRDCSATNFRKLIVTRCQREFEKDSENAKLRETKAKEIEECTDLSEKQNLKNLLEEEERKMRNRSVGNISFIGELFKLGMLTKKTMYFCIEYMLDKKNEDNLENVSKLLNSVGKNLEEIDEDLEKYFKLIEDIINNEGPAKISAPVCKMLQELIELRRNKWESKKDITGDIESSKSSGSIHKYSEIRKMRMQTVETPNLPKDPSSMHVNDSEPRPKSPETLISTFTISQNEQRKEGDFIKQQRPKSKKTPNFGKQKFISPYNDLKIEDRTKIESLYKEILRVSNTSAPEKLETLIEQGRSLQSASQQRILEIVEFILEKATSELSFSYACAFICKELEFLNVTDPELKDENANKFGRVIVSRCKIEFEKNSRIEKSKEMKVKEIEECTDSEKKLALQTVLDEQENKKRMRSLGNMRFIGELFKQGLLTKLIMHGCIKHLLQHKTELNIESLCTLLTTIGKDLETNDDLQGYFDEMQKIINDTCPGNISSEVLNVVKEVIELRKNKWVSRVVDNNPKPNVEIDTTVQTCELENKSSSINELELISESKNLNSISSNLDESEHSTLLEVKLTELRESGTSDEKSSDEDRSLRNENQELSCSSSVMECSVLEDAENGNIPRSPEGKLNEKSTSVVKKPEKSKAELMYVLNGIVEEYLDEANNNEVSVEIKENFSSSNLPMLVCEMINAVVKKSKIAREKISKLLSLLLSEKVITLKDFREGFARIVGMYDVLVADIPQIHTCFAEILLYILIEETLPISELKTTLESLRTKGESGKLVAKLFSKMSDNIGSKSLSEKWRQSGLQLSDIINPEREDIDHIVRNYRLEFLIDDSENLERNVLDDDGNKSNEKDDRNGSVRRSRKYPFKTSKLKNKSLSSNRTDLNLQPKNTESLKMPSSSNNKYEQSSNTNKIFFFKKQGWKIQNRQRQRKFAYDILSTEEKEKFQDLCKEIFHETDGSEPQNFDSVSDLGKTLKSESPERLREIVDFIFDKANQEPSFSSACALMCKELIHTRIFNPKHKSAESLRTLISTRSQGEFEKYSFEEINKIRKLQMQIKIELLKLGKLRRQLEEEEKRMEAKSVTNVKFIGELFKQEVLTNKDLMKLKESKDTHQIPSGQDSVDEHSKSEEQI